MRDPSTARLRPARARRSRRRPAGGRPAAGRSARPRPRASTRRPRRRPREASLPAVRPACRAARNAASSDVAGADRRDRLDPGREHPEAAALALLAQQRDAALLGGDQHVARAHLGDPVERQPEVLFVVELLPDERLGLRLVRRDEERLGLDAKAQRLAFGVEHGRDVAARQVAHRPRRRSRPRHRAAASRRTRPARRPA